MQLAVAQMPGTMLADWRPTLDAIVATVADAARAGAELVVLPECAWPAYCLVSKEAYQTARRAGLPDGQFFVQRVAQAARESRIAVCVGFVEEQGDRLFNAAALVDADGSVLGVRHKSFLWDFDHDYFEPAAEIKPVETRWGPVGIMICADARLPEIPATLAARGARLILHPTAWVNGGTPEKPWNPQPDFLIRARALEFGVPIASASKWGVEGATTFVGSSLICDAQGQIQVQCGQRETQLVIAEVELGSPQRNRPRFLEQELLSGLSAPQRTYEFQPARSLELWLAPKSAGRNTLREHALETLSHLPSAWLVPQALSSPEMDHQFDNKVLIRGSRGGSRNVCGARLSGVPASEVHRFAPLRYLALTGIHLAIVIGDNVPEPLVRARACENRIFVAWCRPNNVQVIAHSGHRLAELAWPAKLPTEPSLVLDLQLAENKSVAPETDVLADRRPELYEF
jgi:predicted amidohydrolase